VTAVVDVPEFKPELSLVLCTAQGRIKRVAADEFSGIRSSGLAAITLEEGDELRWVKLTPGGQEVILISAAGQALRFNEDEVRIMGRSAAGVNAIKLSAGDQLVGMDLVEESNALLVVSERGYAKRTPLNTYPTQSRYGKGVAAFAKTSAQTGRLAAACVVGENDDVTFASASGATLNTTAEKIALKNRSTRGIVAFQVKETDKVVGVVRLAAKADEPAKRGSKSKATKKPAQPATKAVSGREAQRHLGREAQRHLGREAQRHPAKQAAKGIATRKGKRS
jgi:DNA gyrase subunit A